MFGISSINTMMFVDASLKKTQSFFQGAFEKSKSTVFVVVSHIVVSLDVRLRKFPSLETKSSANWWLEDEFSFGKDGLFSDVFFLLIVMGRVISWPRRSWRSAATPCHRSSSTFPRSHFFVEGMMEMMKPEDKNYEIVEHHWKWQERCGKIRWKPRDVDRWHD